MTLLSWLILLSSSVYGFSMDDVSQTPVYLSTAWICRGQTGRIISAKLSEFGSVSAIPPADLSKTQDDWLIQALQNARKLNESFGHRLGRLVVDLKDRAFDFKTPDLPLDRQCYPERVALLLDGVPTLDASIFDVLDSREQAAFFIQEAVATIRKTGNAVLSFPTNSESALVRNLILTENLGAESRRHLKRIFAFPKSGRFSGPTVWGGEIKVARGGFGVDALAVQTLAGNIILTQDPVTSCFVDFSGAWSLRYRIDGTVEFSRNGSFN